MKEKTTEMKFFKSLKLFNKMPDFTPNPTETIISSVESLEIKNEDETKIVLFRLEEKTIAELKKVFNIFNKICT